MFTSEQITAKLYGGTEPSFPDVSDTQIEQDLQDNGAKISQALARAFSAPFLRSFARVEQAVLVQPERVNEAACYHPADEVPYTILPPGLSYPTAEAIQNETYFRDNWDDFIRHEQDIAGRRVYELSKIRARQIQAELASNGPDISYELWEARRKVDDTQHDRDFCSLSHAAAGLLRRRNDASDFVQIERRTIEQCQTAKYPTFLSMQTGITHGIAGDVQMPLTPESDRAFNEELVRSTAVLAYMVGQDTQLRQELEQVLAHPADHDLAAQNTLRALDSPDLPRTLIYGVQESVAKSILPTEAEGLRGFEGEEALVFAEMIRDRFVNRLTQRVPVGYIGPVAVQGTGLTPRVAGRNKSGRLVISEEAKAYFAAMRSFWQREYHYKELKSEGVTPVRTGLGCPFVQVLGERVSATVITAASELQFLIYSMLEGPKHPPKFSRSEPYRPWKAPEITLGPAGLYQGLGRTAARDWLARN